MANKSAATSRLGYISKQGRFTVETVNGCERSIARKKVLLFFFEKGGPFREKKSRESKE